MIQVHLRLLFTFVFLLLTGSPLFASRGEFFDPLDFQNKISFQGKSPMLQTRGNGDGPEDSTPLDRDFEWWMGELKTSLEAINSDNFIFVLENKVCPKLEELKRKRSFFTGGEQEKFLVELVKIYGKVLNYSKNHNYFYCIYNYSDFPKKPDIVETALKVLTQYEDFIEVLNACHKQEFEGNGDFYMSVPGDRGGRFSEHLNHLLTPAPRSIPETPLPKDLYAPFLNRSDRIFPEGIYDFVYASNSVPQNQSQDQQVLESGLVDYFSNTIFENALCRCPGNNRCTRGCVKNGKIPQVRCRGRKNRKTNLSSCMGYVNGAIMATIHSYFGRYCPNSPFDYMSCLDTKGGEGILCEQSFVFPSALCGLGLDGQNRFNLIRNRSVRSNCRNWFRHNGKLAFVDVFGEGEESKKIPLFQEIDMPEDPEDLPDGAIIVSSSNSIHGHIEVKTGKRECGKEGEDVCFCSDFCDSRKNGYKWPFRPQVVFQWHPEFIYHFGEYGDSYYKSL